jgi:hypothetical protein
LSIFEVGSHELFAWGWLRTVILLLSISGVARITGMSHRYPAGRSIPIEELENVVKQRDKKKNL